MQEKGKYGQYMLCDPIFVKGGLNQRNQKIELWFYPQFENLSPKIVLKFGIFNGDVNEYTEKETSIRFDDFFDIQSFIKILQMGKVKLGKELFQVTPQNAEYRITQDIKEVRLSYLSNGRHTRSE